MLRARVGDELVVDAELFHFLAEGSLIVRGHHAVGFAVANEHARLELTGLGHVGAGQGAMKAGHAAQRDADAAHVQRQGTAQAVSHGTDAVRIHERMRLQLLVGRLEAFAECGHVREQAAHQSTCLSSIRRFAPIAVHVGRHRHEAETRELTRPAPQIVVEAPPLR